MGAAAIAALVVTGAGCQHARGPASRLERDERLRIDGARGVDRDEIASRVFVRGPDDGDVELGRARRLYEARGYAEATLEVRRAADGVTRVIDVVEGRRARVLLLTVTADTLPEVRTWPKALPLEASGPISGAALEATHAAIAAGVRAAGCLDADVTHHVEVEPGRDSGALDVRVSFAVAAGACGERYRFGAVLVTGGRGAERERVRRAVRSLVPRGEPFEMTRLAPIRERVRDLGAFDVVRVHPGPPDDARRTVPIVVHLEDPVPRATPAPPLCGC